MSFETSLRFPFNYGSGVGELPSLGKSYRSTRMALNKDAMVFESPEPVRYDFTRYDIDGTPLYDPVYVDPVTGEETASTLPHPSRSPFSGPDAWRLHDGPNDTAFLEDIGVWGQSLYTYGSLTEDQSDEAKDKHWVKASAKKFSWHPFADSRSNAPILPPSLRVKADIYVKHTIIPDDPEAEPKIKYLDESLTTTVTPKTIREEATYYDEGDYIEVDYVYYWIDAEVLFKTYPEDDEVNESYYLSGPPITEGIPFGINLHSRGRAEQIGQRHGWIPFGHGDKEHFKKRYLTRTVRESWEGITPRDNEVLPEGLTQSRNQSYVEQVDPFGRPTNEQPDTDLPYDFGMVTEDVDRTSYTPQWWYYLREPHGSQYLNYNYYQSTSPALHTSPLDFDAAVGIPLGEGAFNEDGSPRFLLPEATERLWIESPTLVVYERTWHYDGEDHVNRIEIELSEENTEEPELEGDPSDDPGSDGWFRHNASWRLFSFVSSFQGGYEGSDSASSLLFADYTTPHGENVYKYRAEHALSAGMFFYGVGPFDYPEKFSGGAEIAYTLRIVTFGDTITDSTVEEQQKTVTVQVDYDDKDEDKNTRWYQPIDVPQTPNTMVFIHSVYGKDWGGETIYYSKPIIRPQV